MSAPLTSADSDGARDRALVLDFCAMPQDRRIDHPVAMMSAEHFFIVWGELARSGLVGFDGVPLSLTPAGFAAQRAPSALDAAGA